LQRCNQDAAAQAAARRGLTSRQVARLVDALLGAPDEPERARLLEQVGLHAATAPPGPSGGARRRTPAEQLAAETFAMKRQSVRLNARLLECPLSSLGAKAATLAAAELRQLRAALVALCGTVQQRLAEQEAADGRRG
jgi:hypothetical protein